MCKDLAPPNHLSRYERFSANITLPGNRLRGGSFKMRLDHFLSPHLSTQRDGGLHSIRIYLKGEDVENLLTSAANSVPQASLHKRGRRLSRRRPNFFFSFPFH